MRYLSAQQILLLHGQVLEQSGGIHGIRDPASLQSVEALPQQVVFGKELYKSPFEKAAVYARTIMMNHPFLDGNKRTGMLTAIVFLEQNSYEFLAELREIENFAVELVVNKHEIPEIAKWFEKRAKK